MREAGLQPASTLFDLDRLEMRKRNQRIFLISSVRTEIGNINKSGHPADIIDFNSSVNTEMGDINNSGQIRFQIVGGIGV